MQINTFFKTLSAAALAIVLAACGGQKDSAPAASAASEAAPAETTAPADAAPASEAAPADAAAAPAAGNCATTVEANDAMQFNTKEIQVSKACKEFTITLKHTGTQPKASMGHNIVIGKTEDMDGIFKDGVGAADTDYVKPDDARVVAHTKLIGGGEESSLTLDPAKLADGEYKFACTFPGHGALMNGKVTLVD